MKRLAIIAGAMAVSLGLAGCETSGYYPRFNQPTGVEGEWIGTDRVAVSEFRGGNFTSRAIDTGNELARGTYRYRDARMVEITFTSLLRQTTVNANCALIAATQMNCTSSTGAQFTLVRR